MFTDMYVLKETQKVYDSWVHMLKTDSAQSLDHTWVQRKQGSVFFRLYWTAPTVRHNGICLTPTFLSLSLSHHHHPTTTPSIEASVQLKFTLHNVILATNGDSCPS